MRGCDDTDLATEVNNEKRAGAKTLTPLTMLRV
jgi:hypothetical protein